MNDILQKITNVLEKYLDKKEYKFFLFGSRAKGDFFFRSDYDIGVLGDKEISYEIISKIKDDFEDIPALIDFTDFSKVSDEFKELAMNDIIIFK